MDCKKLLLVIACGAAFVLFGASCGGNTWSVLKAGPASGSIGLWKGCVDEDSCEEIPDDFVKDKWKVIRAFSLLAVLMSIVAGLMAILGLCTDKVKGFLSSIFLVVAAVCMAIALGIYIDETEERNFEIEIFSFTFKMTYGWSFYLGWVGCVIAIAGSILGCLAK